MPLELLLITHTVKSHAISSVAPLARAAALRRSGCTRNSTAAAVAREDEGSDDDDDVATRGPTRGHPSPLQTWRPPVVTPVAPTAPAARRA